MGRDADANRIRRQDPAGFHATDRWGHPVTIGSELLWVNPAGFKMQLVDVRPVMDPRAPAGTCVVKFSGMLQVVFQGALFSGKSIRLDDFTFIGDRPIFDEAPGDMPQPPAETPAVEPGQDPPDKGPADLLQSPTEPAGPALIQPPDQARAPLLSADGKPLIHLV